MADRECPWTLRVPRYTREISFETICCKDEAGLACNPNECKKNRKFGGLSPHKPEGGIKPKTRAEEMGIDRQLKKHN